MLQYFKFFMLAFFITGCNEIGEYIEDTTQTPTIIFQDKFKLTMDSLIIKLPSMKTDTLGCNADVYWKIVKRGKESIIPLIESLTDTTITNIYHPCKKGKLNIGEVSYFALEEIAEFPAFSVTQTQFDWWVNDCWSFYEYLFDNRNKPSYQNEVRVFYCNNKFKFVEYKKSELNDCHKKFEILGKLKWVN